MATQILDAIHNYGITLQEAVPEPALRCVRCRWKKKKKGNTQSRLLLVSRQYISEQGEGGEISMRFHYFLPQLSTIYAESKTSTIILTPITLNEVRSGSGKWDNNEGSLFLTFDLKHAQSDTLTSLLKHVTWKRSKVRVGEVR